MIINLTRKTVFLLATIMRFVWYSLCFSKTTMSLNARSCAVTCESVSWKQLRVKRIQNANKMCDCCSKMCGCEKQMKECLVEIFSSKFNQILMNSGFSLGGKLRSLNQKLSGERLPEVDFNYQQAVLGRPSVRDIAMEAEQVYNIFTIIFSVAKFNIEVDEEFIENIHGTEFTVNELIVVAQSLKKRTETLLEESGSNRSILDTIWKQIKKHFPHRDLTDQRGKFEKIIKDNLEAQHNSLEIANIVIDEVLAIGLNNINENLTNISSSMDFLEFPLAAPEDGKFHDFESPGIYHYYVATSQYYKMLLQPPQEFFSKPIQNKANSVQSIEHISNPKTLENYNAKKKTFKEAGKVNEEKKVREMLLFHGTDAANIDSILKDGFNVNFNPKHKSKMQLYGKGIYMAEHPEMAFNYGNIILICKVEKHLSLNLFY